MTERRALRRSPDRLTAFLRLLLVITQVIVLAQWAVGAEIAAVIGRFAGVALGRVVAGLHDFMASFGRSATGVRACKGTLLAARQARLSGIG